MIDDMVVRTTLALAFTVNILSPRGSASHYYKRLYRTVSTTNDRYQGVHKVSVHNIFVPNWPLVHLTLQEEPRGMLCFCVVWRQYARVYASVCEEQDKAAPQK